MIFPYLRAAEQTKRECTQDVRKLTLETHCGVVEVVLKVLSLAMKKVASLGHPKLFADVENPIFFADVVAEGLPLE